jgi:transposase
LRQIIRYNIEKESPFLEGDIEVDESYFGGVRKGKRGRGAVGKTAVFGLLKRGGKVYSQVVGDTKAQTLLPIIRDRVKPDSIVYSDYYGSYNALDVSEFKHYRINHSNDLTQKPQNYKETALLFAREFEDIDEQTLSKIYDLLHKGEQ